MRPRRSPFFNLGPKGYGDIDEGKAASRVAKSFGNGGGCEELREQLRGAMGKVERVNRHAVAAQGTNGGRYFRIAIGPISSEIGDIVGLQELEKILPG